MIMFAQGCLLFTPVIPEVVLSSEGLVADVACIRPLICVRPLVDQKVVGFGKMAAAELADELLFGLGGQSTPTGLALRRRELGHVQETSQGGGHRMVPRGL